jgi:serine/threonine-protein kinase
VTNEFEPETAVVQQALSEVKVFTRINSGGQKIVYVAEHPEYGKIALKLIRPGTNSERDRILRELTAAGKLTDNHFPKIYHVGETKIGTIDVLYIFEEFLDGNLAEIITAKEKLNITEIWTFIRELLRALVTIGENGIVHRDIKPANIFITPQGRTVLIDFGIARHLQLPSITYDYALLGPLTPGYAAPEQIRNEKRKIDARTDLFAVGIVIYECLTGKNPFIEDCDARKSLDRNLNYNPPPLTTYGIKSDVSDFVSTCLQKHASRRFCSPAKALEAWEKIGKEVK